MGHSKPRSCKSGNRYTAIYIDSDGLERSAGTFRTQKESDDAWKAAEAKVNAGKGGHLIRGRVGFQAYTEQTWLPNLTVEVKTVENYTYNLYAHLMGFFGHRRMNEIYVSDVREWLTERKAAGVSPATRKKLKQLLSSILSSAVADEVIASNPCLLVKTERVPVKPLQIITPAQFDQFYTELPDSMSKLLVETAIETGGRWGELTELRVKDWNSELRAFTISRAVVQVRPEFHPDGKRFFVKDYPKNGEYRIVKVAPHLASKIDAHIALRGLKDDDLLFWYQSGPQRTSRRVSVSDTAPRGRTTPNERGRTYKHGTMSAYTAGRCRCDFCRNAMATYRRNRRSEGKDNPRQARRWDTDGHIPNRWFRDQVIRPALKEAGIKTDIRMHLLRHAHASWLLNGGADLMVVKERLGHGSITTTERYLHTVDNADETALAALDKIRKSRGDLRDMTLTESGNARPELTSIGDVLAEMARLQEVLGKLAGQGGKTA